MTETSNVSQKSYSDLGLVQDENGTWTKTIWGNGKIAFTDTNNNGFYDDGEDKWKYSTVGRTIGPNEEREVLELVNQLQKQQVPEPELGR
ncbi:MAG: hypothetical protein J5598_02125 [Clostridia bacterium]|nr:hypothetical protein [Clostridia bacterium]